MPLAEELGPGQHLERGVREHEHDQEVRQCGEAKGEGEAADVSNSDEVQHQRGEQVDGLGRQHRALGALPTVRDGGHEPFALTKFVADAFEVHDEGVGGLTNGHDETCHAGQGQPVVFSPTKDGDGEVRESAGHHEGEDGDEAQGPVLEERIDHHEQEADHTGQQTETQLLATEGGGNLLLGLDVEADGQSAVAKLVRQGLCGCLGEVTGDLRLAVGDDGEGTRRGNDLVIQDDGELGLGVVAALCLRCHVELVEPLGNVLERLGGVGIERDSHAPRIGDRALCALDGIEGGRNDVLALHLDRAKDVLDGRSLGRCGLTCHQRLGGIRPRLLVLGGIDAVQGFESLVNVRGDPVAVAGVCRRSSGLGQACVRRPRRHGNGSRVARGDHRSEVHVGRRLDQGTGFRSRRPGKAHHDVTAGLCGDFRFGNAGAVNALADDRDGLVQAAPR